MLPSPLLMYVDLSTHFLTSNLCAYAKKRTVAAFFLDYFCPALIRLPISCMVLREEKLAAPFLDYLFPAALILILRYLL